MPGKRLFRDLVTAVMALLAVLLMGGCAARTFPVVQPVMETSRTRASKARAEEYFVLARDYERRGLDGMAERFFELAYELDPTSGVLKEELARKYLEGGKYTQALLLVKGNRKLTEITRSEKRLLSSVYLKMGEFAKAADVLESIGDRTEEETYSLGLIYESLGNTPKALKRYREFYNRSGQSLQMGLKIGRLLIMDKQYTAAETLYADLGTHHPENADVHGMTGLVKALLHDTTAALAFFDKALEIDSAHEESLRSKAQIHLQRGDYEKAVPLYERLHNNEYYGEVYGRSLAILYYYNGQHKKAGDLLNSLLQTAIDDYELHYYLGLVFLGSGKTEQGRIEIEKALAMNPGLDDGWRELCYLAIRENDFEQALLVVKRFVSLKPKSGAAWRLAGYVRALRKEYPEAIRALAQAVAIDSSDTYALFELGSAYERNKEYRKAAQAFRGVLKLRPGDPAASNYLGYMWAERGERLDSAKTLLESALSRDSDNGAYLDSYAWVFFQMGDFDKAHQYMTRAVAKIDNDPVIYSHLGDILVKKKEFSAAASAYRRSLELDSDDADSIRKKLVELEVLMKGEL